MYPSHAPTPYHRLRFAQAAYTRHLDLNVHSAGFRIYEQEEHHDSGLLLVLFTPTWFPDGHVDASFDYNKVNGDHIHIGFVFRGTDFDHYGNLKSDFDLVLAKFTDSNKLPDVAQRSSSLVIEHLQSLLDTHPNLRTSNKKLVIHFIGHSLGGFIAESATILCHDFATIRNLDVICTTFDSPGVPSYYTDLALQMHPDTYWKAIMRHYLGAPNPINMLYRHLGSITHVTIPFGQRVSHMTKCVMADAARTAAAVWLGSKIIAASSALTAGTASAAAAEASTAVATAPAAASATTSAAAASFVRSSFGSVSSLLAGAAEWVGSVTAYKVLSYTALVIGVETQELLEQHRIENMFPCFHRQHPGELKQQYRRDMASWPQLGAAASDATRQQLAAVAAWLLPSYVAPSNMGVANMFGREEAVLRRCAQLPGYVPLAAAAVSEPPPQVSEGAMDARAAAAAVGKAASAGARSLAAQASGVVRQAWFRSTQQPQQQPMLIDLTGD